jgi:serine/threonine protein kinase/tetratricopeptide (TPR) repeat protein
MVREPSHKQLKPGSVLGHFALSEVIGAGGMGLVYKAVDTRLDRTVAVKVLSSKLFRDKKARSRFIREAKLAAAIAHPNVATVHEIDEQDGVPFIAMELVPGSNLKDKVCHHPLPLSEAISVGKQICDALEAAHEHGVIHRDVKSSNIMVTPDGQVKVLDFGLAKALAEPVVDPDLDEEQLTRERHLAVTRREQGDYLTTAQGVALGTPSYMSPEQASGKPVDPRTDIFSLGIVLYEAISGVLPFKGRSDQELLEAIRSKDPTPLHVEEGKIPRAFSKVISTCLSKEPEKRFPSAFALREALSRLEIRFPRINSFVDNVVHTSAGRIGLTSILVLLMAALIRWPPSEWLQVPPPLPLGTKIVLADFDNQTEESRLDAVQKLFEVQLRQSAHLSIVSRSSIRQALQKMVLPSDAHVDLELARNIAWREGSPIVAGASLLEVGGNYVLTVRMDRIGDSPSPEATWSNNFRALSKDLIYDAVDEATRWVRATVGETAQELSMRDASGRESTTASWEALELYRRADEAQYAGRTEDAQLLLKEALELDSDFAMAWARLADISYLERQKEVFSYYQRALDAMKRRQLTKSEELRIKAIYAHDSRDYVNAERLFRTYALSYPKEFAAVNGYAYSLLVLGRDDEALQKFLEAELLNPNASLALVNVALAYLTLGRLEDVRTYVARVRELGNDGWADELEGATHFLEGEYEAAIDVFLGLSRAHDLAWQSVGYSHLALVLAEIGRFQEAISALKEGLSIDPQLGQPFSKADKLLALAHIYYRQGDREACRGACVTAMEVESGADRLLRAGTLLARTGFVEEAKRVLSLLGSSRNVPLFAIVRHRITGEILLSQGKTHEALRELRQAFIMDTPAHLPEYLARALTISGDLEEAHKLYKRMSNSPGQLWRHEYLVNHPGLWAESLLQYAQLSQSLESEQEAYRAVTRYLDLRQKADAGLYDQVRAWDLASQLNQELNNRPDTDDAQKH